MFHTCFASKVSSKIPDELRTALAPLLSQIDALTEAIWGYDVHLEHLALTRYSDVARLTQVAWVGTLAALTFILCTSDPHCFARSRDVGCFLGLRPKQRQSGQRNPELGITKAGNELVRRTLMQSAHYIVGAFGPDADLRYWGRKLAGQGKGTKRRAIAAVARKLAVLLHRLWVSGDSYIPLRPTQSQSVSQAA